MAAVLALTAACAVQASDMMQSTVLPISQGATPVQQAATWIPLRNGVEVSFLGAGEMAPTAAQRTLIANFATKTPTVLKQPAKLIEAADELFGRFVILTADQSGFTRVVINVKKGETQTLGQKIPAYEDFVYVRGANTVWLRQAGKETWKVAQDPKFDAKALQVLDVKGVGKIEIEAVAEINAPSGSRRAIGIDIRTDTPNKNQFQKYREIRATWIEADRATLLQRGFDFVAIQSFSAKRLGKFQVRQMAYVQIQREQGKDWPEMPASPPSSKSKPPLTAELSPEFLTAAISQSFQLQPAPIAGPIGTAIANLELGEAVAVAALEPTDPEIQARAFKTSVSTSP